MIYELSFPETPPSFNVVGHTGNRWTWTKEKRRWQENIEMGLMVEQVPRGMAFVKANATIRFPDSRKRDVVNYRTILEKCLGDALVNGGWISDDTPDEFHFDRVTFLTKGKPETTLILETE